MIDRLHRLYILDGSPYVYANLAREWERRDMRWCGGVKHEPPMTLEELRDWAEVTFFEDGLRATIETGVFCQELGVYLRRASAPTGAPSVARAWLSDDGRPRFRFYNVVVERANYMDFCAATLGLRHPYDPRHELTTCHMEPGTRRWFHPLNSSSVCLPHSIPSGSCTESC